MMAFEMTWIRKRSRGIDASATMKRWTAREHLAAACLPALIQEGPIATTEHLESVCEKAFDVAELMVVEAGKREELE